MDAYLQKTLLPYQHLKIPLEEIISATNNFDDQKNYIGGGGFGKVYKGELSHIKGRSMVAIKRLNPKFGQGLPEFLKEIMTLGNYKHANLISLLGFCCEGPEMILVYEHASRGSLDRHLNSDNLTWIQRLKICIDVAEGLSYLHDPRETHQRLIHCDVKSANILLNDKWNAKIADFGLSIMGPANEQQSIIVTNAAGTPGYCDPQYAMTHTLTKESDVYSLGVVLFEVLCGTLCCTYSNDGIVQKLVPMWIESYKQKKLNDIIFKDPAIQPLDQRALQIYSDIAYRCLDVSREDRPKMAEVVVELEAALEKIFDAEGIRICNMDYRSNGELMQILSKGILLNKGKTWFSLNKKGEHCEMRSFGACAHFDLSEYERERQSRYQREYQSQYDNSRFYGGTYLYSHQLIKTYVRAQFLSPGITYTVNLVFKFLRPYDKSIEDHGYYTAIGIRYGLQDETYNGYIDSYASLAYEREDGLWSCELYQFTSYENSVSIRISFMGFSGNHDFLVAEGIEFLPLEDVEHYKDEEQPNILESDADWEEKLPTDYEDMMKLSINNMQWTTEKEAYSLLRKGFLIDDGKKWFSLDKNGKKCHMLPADLVFVPYDNDGWSVLPLPESRFGNVMRRDDTSRFNLQMCINIESPQLLSSETTYASYLVYKLPKGQSEYNAPFEVHYYDEQDSVSKCYWFIYLLSPQVEVIRFEGDQNSHNPANRLNMKGLPQERNDGWMEVQFWEFQTPATTEPVHRYIYAKRHEYGFLKDFIVKGIEFRPI